MPQEHGRSVEELADEIRLYLDRHPKAADTLEGIRAWWVADRHQQESPEHIARALDHLVRIGAIELHRMPGDRQIYFRKGRP